MAANGFRRGAGGPRAAVDAVFHRSVVRGRCLQQPLSLAVIDEVFIELRMILDRQRLFFEVEPEVGEFATGTFVQVTGPAEGFNPVHRAIVVCAVSVAAVGVVRGGKFAQDALRTVMIIQVCTFARVVNVYEFALGTLVQVAVTAVMGNLIPRLSRFDERTLVVCRGLDVGDVARFRVGRIARLVCQEYPLTSGILVQIL